VIISACWRDNPAAPSVGLNEPFTLAPNAAAVIAGAGIRLQFVSVTGDSRCPADVVCIQGGDAIVHVRATDSRGSADYELHTGDSSRASAEHQGFRVTLTDLTPFPFSSRAVAPGEYRATFTVTR
jgi:hypothetical protein